MDGKSEKFENIQISFIHPLQIKSQTMLDMFYVTDKDRKLKCMRIYNIKYSFIISRLPGLNDDQFIRFMSIYKDMFDIKTVIRKNIRDGGYFSFNENRLHLEIFSTSVYELSALKRQLISDFIIYYNRINIDDLNEFDKMFYKNTEHPFRLSSLSTSISKSMYYLSTRYNIPLIGGVTINHKYLNSDILEDISFMPKWVDRSNIIGLNANPDKLPGINKGIENCIKRNDNINFSHNLTMISYDIETYGINGNLDPKATGSEIICIGIGIFNIFNNYPIKRYCIIQSDKFDQIPKYSEDKSQLSELNVVEMTKIINGESYKTYVISNEYHNNSTKKIKNSEDKTMYICSRNEKNMLKLFIYIVYRYHPRIISGFNTFGFDDNYLFERMKYYDLTKEYLSIYSPYDIDERGFPKCFIPKFEKNFKLKGLQHDNSTVRSLAISNIDVHRIILMEDEKRFSEKGRGKLDGMLKLFMVKNPYTDVQLTKTDMQINDMFKYWKKKINLYRIALYCCQDAWITGTLLINRGKISDLMEMSNISYTDFSDSIYKANNIRVTNGVISYAYKYGFAQMDEILGKRHNLEEARLGMKEFDMRTLVGGDVKSLEIGRKWCVVALDYSSMYPSQKEGSNIDSSSRIDEDYLIHPDKYELTIKSKETITDMYGERDVFIILDSNGKEYTIEGFKCEYKTESKEFNDLLKIINDKNLDDKDKEWNKACEEIKTYFPEFPEIKKDQKYTLKDFPEKSAKNVFYVQSKTSKETEIYSLQGKLLSDFRVERNKAKSEKSKALKENDRVLAMRFESKQLAIKVLCNSNYGVGGNKDLVLFDSDVGGSVTFCSRRIIEYLSICLSANALLVDNTFINNNNNKTNIDALLREGACVIEETKYDSKITKIPKLDRISEKSDDSIYKITIPPSIIIYQDTDSNYYTNNGILNILYDGTVNMNPNVNLPNDSEFKNISPDSVKKVMDLLLNHNSLMSKFIEESINRKPISASFEGAFVVCRYNSVKKNYYGYVYKESMKTRLCEEAYDNNVLKEDYRKYWEERTLVPLKTGEYFELSINDLLRNNTYFMDYSYSKGIKCTGVQPVRRDRFPFSNFYFTDVMRKDLKIMTYSGNNIWKPIPRNETMLNIIKDTLRSFNNLIIKYSEILSSNHANIEDLILFNIEDFAKSTSYKPDKNSIATHIIKRLHNDNKQQYIPEIGERILYVITKDVKTRNNRRSGLKKSTKVSERSLLIEELKDIIEKEFPENNYKRTDLTYDQYINIKMILELDMEYYRDSLSKSLINFITNEDEINDIAKRKYLKQLIENPILYSKDMDKDYKKLSKYFSRDINDYAANNYVNMEKVKHYFEINDTEYVDNKEYLLSYFKKKYNYYFEQSNKILDKIYDMHYGETRLINKKNGSSDMQNNINIVDRMRKKCDKYGSFINFIMNNMT